MVGPPMPVMSYGRAFSWLAHAKPDQPAVVHDGRTVTRGQLDRSSNRLARAFAGLGVGAGDLVTLALPNGIGFIEATLATWKLGATPAPISSRLPEAERRALVELANPALVVGAPEPHAGRASVPADHSPDASLDDGPLPDVVPARVRAMTSGGSTGRPKLILDTSPAETDPTVAENGMAVDGSILVAGPLYHAGPFITCWQSLLCGGTAVVMTRFDAAEALRLLSDHAIRWVLFVPTMMQRIWKLPAEQRDAADLSALERVMCTGAPSPAWLKRAWIDWLGPERIYEAYGGTERIAGTLISGTEWLAHPGSVGKPSPERQIVPLRPDGTRCTADEVGELYMLPATGQGSTYAYVGAEADARDGGWESVGDMGWLDADGYLYLADRKTDMIVVGGANVYPAEVEAAIDAHPAVRSSAVIGLPDPDLGQRIHALVDAPGGLDEETLRSHLSEQLVRYKQPRSYEWVSEPLRDDAGKVRRSALRAARLPAESPSP